MRITHIVSFRAGVRGHVSNKVFITTGISFNRAAVEECFRQYRIQSKRK
jgi:hypothetical protein